MEKRFCPNCGVELVATGAFCANCGCPLSAPQQMPMQQVPMTYVPARNSKKIGLIVAGVIAAVAVVVGVILAIVLSGGDSGKDDPLEDAEVLTEYRYKDILGSYSGKAAVEVVAVDENYTTVADAMDYTPEDTLLGYEGEEFDCTFELEEDALTVVLSKPILGGSKKFEIKDIKFVDGIAEGSYGRSVGFTPGTEGYQPMDPKSVKTIGYYDLALCPSEDSDCEYRICGTLRVSCKVMLMGCETTYEIELTVDCEK